MFDTLIRVLLTYSHQLEICFEITAIRQLRKFVPKLLILVSITLIHRRHFTFDSCTESSEAHLSTPVAPLDPAILRFRHPNDVQQLFVI